MNFLAFVSDHLHLVGWPTLLTLVWKAGKYVSKLSERFDKAEATLELMATNHAPHLQASLDELNKSVEKGFNRLEAQLTSLGQSILILANKEKD